MLTKEEAQHILDMLDEMGNMVDFDNLDEDEAKLHESACDKLRALAGAE